MIHIDTSYLKADPSTRVIMMYMAAVWNFFVNLWDKVYGFFTSYHWKAVLLDIKLISLIISLFFAVLIIFLVSRMNAKNRFQKAMSQDKSSPKINDKKIVKKWAKIEKKLDSGSEANYKLAILEADALFDYILKVIGYNAEIRVSNIGEIKELKKITKNIIDNSGFKITREEAEKIIGIYKKGLNDLGLI